MQCPACGSEVEDGIRKCPVCGAIYLGGIGKKGEPLKSKPWLVPFLLGLLLNVLGVIIAYTIYRNSRMFYEEDPTKRAVLFSILGLVYPATVFLFCALIVIIIIQFQ